MLKTPPPLTTDKNKLVQQTTGIYMWLARVIGSTMLLAVGTIATNCTPLPYAQLQQKLNNFLIMPPLALIQNLCTMHPKWIFGHIAMLPISENQRADHAQEDTPSSETNQIFQSSLIRYRCLQTHPLMSSTSSLTQSFSPPKSPKLAPAPSMLRILSPSDKPSSKWAIYKAQHQSNLTTSVQ